MTALQSVGVTDPDDPMFQAGLALYRASFPEWEREPDDIVIERVGSGRYTFHVALEAGRLIGFYILDLNPDFGYALFSFIGIAEPERGRGLGTVLCREVVAWFKARAAEDPRYRWLLIEGEDRQAAFYGRLGFRKICLEYLSPHFDGPGSEPMHLLTEHAGQIPERIGGDELRAIVRHLFVSGYSLPPEDPRIGAQLAKVADEVKLVSWPEGSC